MPQKDCWGPVKSPQRLPKEPPRRSKTPPRRLKTSPRRDFNGFWKPKWSQIGNKIASRSGVIFKIPWKPKLPIFPIEFNHFSRNRGSTFGCKIEQKSVRKSHPRWNASIQLPFDTKIEPKTPPRRSKAPQDAPRCPKRRLKPSQDILKKPQNAPRRLSRRPQDAPRHTQDAPRQPPHAPRHDQATPISSKRRPDPPGPRFWTILATTFKDCWWDFEDLGRILDGNLDRHFDEFKFT